MGKKANLFFDSSELNPDLRYAVGFHIGDPVLYFEIEGKKYLMLSDLEIDRGKEEATVDEIVPLSDYILRINRPQEGYSEIIDLFLKDHGVTDIAISDKFSALHYKNLVEKGYNIEIKKSPFYSERKFKTAQEREKIRGVMKNVDIALQKAFNLLRDSKIDGDYIKYGEEIVTSEMMKRLINTELLQMDTICRTIIVASGMQAIDPHNTGSGPLIPNTPIIFDVFPQSLSHGYFGDQTRTVLKGKASDEQKRLFNTVLKGQKLGVDMLKAGVNGADIHIAINRMFESNGYKTGLIDGRMQGFFHGTGHGLGLEIHEEPRVSSAAQEIMKAGYVVTIEPGLYYKEIGGVRIEDTLFVTEDGSDNLAFTDIFFEIE
ncbi:aminopeptidase P family protein [bacterium]|nr:aminopeptidase P family protein [bacterium]